MKKAVSTLAVCALCALLMGCSMLERSYSSVQPHSSSYYESEDKSVLRAENYQDLVNDLLLLIADEAESGTIWLYGDETAESARLAIEDACREVQQQTPMGAYAVEYMTYAVGEDTRPYQEIVVQLSYRRTAAQMESIVHATSVSALPDLLRAAAEAGKEELVVQLGYFDAQADEVRRIVAETAAEQGTAPDAPWEVYFYPNQEQAGIVEILLKN